MHPYVRVFLKGEPVRWFDFPTEGKSFHSFVMQARFEGFIVGETGYLVHDQVLGMMLIHVDKPTQTLHGMVAAGQA